MDFIRNSQLEIMLFLSGCCGVLVILTLMPKFMSRRRKIILALMEMASMLMLCFDRLAYIYRGNISDFGGFMVRLSNGMCYFLVILIPFLVTAFIRDLFKNEGKSEKSPKLLVACDFLFLIGTALIIISQFTGLYYTFDSGNNYVRSAGNFISYIVPVLVVIIQEIVVIRNRKILKTNLVISLVVCIILPTVASVIQFLFYGLSLISITMAVVVMIFYIYNLFTLAEEVEQAKKQEIDFYKEAQKIEATLFEETTESLTKAIDAKDNYTRGHSARVAVISELIAKEAGYSESECNKVYFAALLHDVGKIGVRDDVINKHGKLTEEEYEQIKLHTVYGNQILSSIRQSPYLSIGAHYHHERFDGKGYPEGLSGENIPEIARIIAVADAYDAMTSTRSYRSALSKEEVKSEFRNEMGKQFDDRFAAIMLKLMDDGTVEKSELL